MTIDYEEAVRKGKAIVAEMTGKQWALGDLADTVEKAYGENRLEQFAHDISFPGAACTLGRCRDVCRAFPKNRVRPRFFASAQVLATHPDRLEIVKHNPAISKAEAGELMREWRAEQNGTASQEADEADNDLEETDNGTEPTGTAETATEPATPTSTPAKSKGGKTKRPVDERETQINESKRLLRLHLKLANDMIGAAEVRKNLLSAEQREYMSTAALQLDETLETMEKAGEDWLEYVARLKELKAEKEAWIEAKYGVAPVRASAPAERAAAEPAQVSV